MDSIELLYIELLYKRSEFIMDVNDVPRVHQCRVSHSESLTCRDGLLVEHLLVGVECQTVV